MTDEPIDNLPSPPEEKNFTTREERRRRLDAVRKLIQTGLYDGQIKKMIAEQFGCARKTVNRYISIVRKEIALEYSPAECETQKNGASEFYRGIYSNPAVPYQARLRAMEDWVELLGLGLTPELRVSGTIEVGLSERVKVMEKQNLSEEDLQLLIKAGEIAAKAAVDDDGEEA